MAENTSLPSAWFETGFDPANTIKFNLFVLASQDGLVFALIKPGSTKLSALVRIANAGIVLQTDDASGLRVRLEGSGLPLGTYHMICLVMRSERYSILPAALSLDSLNNHILSMRHSLKAGEEIQEERKGDFVSLFAGRPALQNLLREYASTMKLASYGLIVAGECMRLSAGDRTVLLADFGSGILDVAIADKGGLKFCNSFSATTAEDAAYHLLNVIRQQEKPTQIYLCGNFTKESTASALITPYLPDVVFYTSEKLEMPGGLSAGYSDLTLFLNQMLCG